MVRTIVRLDKLAVQHLISTNLHLTSIESKILLCHLSVWGRLYGLSRFDKLENQQQRMYETNYPAHFFHFLTRLSVTQISEFFV